MNLKNLVKKFEDKLLIPLGVTFLVCFYISVVVLFIYTL